MNGIHTIVLLAGILAVNANMLCHSVCLTKHNEMADSHAKHRMDKLAAQKGDMCPISHEAGHANTHHSEGSSQDASIKCDCSVDNNASLGYEATLAEPFGKLTPTLQIISKINPQKTTFLSKEPIPLEGPPKLLV
jgi:hypothetical protein